ncbi:DUF1524 domain-containing protein [Nesterenkonia salmonea]|uniref:DUF1524 domain-containing protein n=1 Tax=Nesterenkonia salmonea TaxID=1804987 RepID=A0A5R9B7F1_9MICC|nr:DUF1524 domain-containing protein [Nesterenkonia salmonea]TLP93044.1 DUF1524 domain-containing protein [Nesterenkonia salmonea]
MGKAVSKSSAARRRRALPALATATATAVALGLIAAPPAAAYATPDEVPNPFQEYTAQDYADALWNLNTSTWVRTYERETQDDCDVLTYTASHPLESEPTRTYVHIADEDDWWCAGDEGDQLRDELDALDDDDEHFHHGRPYENTQQRVPYYGTWADVNGNGVTSRTEIHARDLGNSSFTISGTYQDHYTGQRVNIAETETHGEHMIPVGHTWPEMQHRPREARVAYYNDPMNLTSTIGEINREKAGHTPTEWMPSNEDAHCAYSMTWAHIANKHQLSLYQRDVDQLRDQLWDCLREELHDDGSGSESWGADQRSPDLDWQSLPPDTDPEDVTEEPGGGPAEHYSTRDYTDALWNLENHIRIRSVDREEHEECDVQTHTTTHPRTGETHTYHRVISPENTYCGRDEGDQLREELEEKAEDDDTVFHSNPMDGQRRDAFGYWAAGDDGLNTRHHVLSRDLDNVEWNSTETAVTAGDFHDPYTGDPAEYEGPSTIIDHLLPVSHAWADMEHRDAEQRRDYYNDPENLIAVTEDSAQDRAQQSEGTYAPRNWMPEHEDFHCRYATAWTHAAASHDISLFASDIRQLRQTLLRCVVEETEDGGIDSPRREELQWAGLPPW